MTLLRLIALTLISLALTAATPRAQRQDPHLCKVNDPSQLDHARYTFKEKFTYSLQPDSSRFGTLEHFRQLYPDSYWKEKLPHLTNEDGSLAWLVSRDMMALVSLYDATQDPWFLQWLARYAEAAMAARDDRSGKRDEEGRSGPGWSTPRYGEGARRIYLVHSGLIIQPILEWALRADRAPGWTEADERRRRKVIEQCKETLLYHDYQIAEDASPGEIVYVAGREEKDRRFTWQPYNRQNQLARDFYLLYTLTGDEEYRERSRKLYAFFKNRIERTPSDAYIWEYEPIKGMSAMKVSVCDDVSHASFTLEPIISACLDGFVFGKEDLSCFARTFTLYIHLGDGVFQSTIGCQPSFSPRYMDRLYAWLPLAQADPSIYWLLRSFLMHNFEKPPALAIAYLIVYRPKGIGGIDTRAR